MRQFSSSCCGRANGAGGGRGRLSRVEQCEVVGAFLCCLPGGGAQRGTQLTTSFFEEIGSWDISPKQLAAATLLQESANLQCVCLAREKKSSRCYR